MEALHPTYFALRDATTLYTESWDGNLYDPGTLFGLELYDILSDPYELDSLMHYPEDVPDPVLNPLLELLKSCIGATCKQYEDMTPDP